MDKYNLFIDSNFTIKESNTDSAESITIEGYANTTDKDRVGDVILREAWEKGGLENYKMNPIILGNHNYSNPIGQAIDINVTDKGLYIAAKISKSIGVMYELIKEGIVKSFSIGFSVKDADYDSASNIFVIKDLELYEISVVSVPANQYSLFSVKKGLGEEKYAKFKQELLNTDTSSKEVIASDDEVEDIEEINMDKLTELEEKIKKLTDQLTAKDSTIAKQVLAALQEQKEAEQAKLDAEKAEATKKAAIVTEATTGVENLVKEVEERLATKFEEENGTLKTALSGLETELKEKADEIEAMRKGKMTFMDREADSKVASKEVETAVILSKILNKSIEDTAFGKQLLEKAGPHVAGMTEDWEQTFSTTLNSEIREKLVVEPLFRSIEMTAPTMHMPINPEAGYGEWIAGTYPPLGSTDNSSTGTPVTHALADTTILAHKLASKEYIAYEEEEDSIIPLIPIINDAIVRRMAKSSDKAILIGTGAGAADPLVGVATAAAATGGAAQTTLSIGGGDKVTVATLQTVRRGLGVWGTDPMDVMYIVSNDAYFDLLEDPDFRTTDLVGDKATILRGQIGTVNGSKVIISGEYATKGAAEHAVVAVNTSNFIVGNLRNLTLERDRDVVNQTNVLVATRRMAFKQILSNSGVSVLTWAA